MAIHSDYCTLADLKAHLRITDTNDDTYLALVITGASRAVDQFCNRPFGLTGSAIQRLYTWHGEQVDGKQALAIDDLMTTVGLVVTADTAGTFTYSTTLVLNTDFDLFPYNAIADGVPFTHIVRRDTSTQPWPTPQDRARAFSVVGNWGWTTVPSMVEIATLVTAARQFVLRDAPLGESGNSAQGNVKVASASLLDPSVKLGLQDYVRPWGAA